MDEHSEPPSPAGRTLLALAPVDHEWQPILHVSNQVVLYNPTSHAISIRTHSRQPSPLQVLARNARCPCCHREISPTSRRRRRPEDSALGDTFDEDEGIERATNRAANYFQLLEIANESSRPPSPTPEAPPQSNAFRSENMAEGYFRAFFQEVCRLGMGANGSVFLCQVCALTRPQVATLNTCSIACLGRESSRYASSIYRCETGSELLPLPRFICGEEGRGGTVTLLSIEYVERGTAAAALLPLPRRVHINAFRFAFWRSSTIPTSSPIIMLGLNLHSSHPSVPKFQHYSK